MVLSKDTFEDGGRTCRKASCAACKAPLGLMLMDCETLMAPRKDLLLYRVAGGNTQAQAQAQTQAEAQAQRSGTGSPPNRGQKGADPALDVRKVVAAEVARLKVELLREMTTRETVEDVVDDVVKEELGKVKFTLLALNNQTNKLASLMQDVVEQRSAKRRKRGGGSASNSADDKDDVEIESGEED